MEGKKKKQSRAVVNSTEYVRSTETTMGVMFLYRYTFKDVKGSVLGRHLRMSPFKAGKEVIVTGNYKDKSTGEYYASIADPKYGNGEGMMNMMPKAGAVTTTTDTLYHETIDENSVAPKTVLTVTTADDYLKNVPEQDDIIAAGSVDQHIELTVIEHQELLDIEKEYKKLKQREYNQARYKRLTDAEIEEDILNRTDIAVSSVLASLDNTGDIIVSDSRLNALELASQVFNGRGEAADPSAVIKLADTYYKWLITI
jgi:hypothetical protein